MITIKTPNEQFNGERAGVQFRDGVATVPELAQEQRDALQALGYAMDEPNQEPPALADMTIAQMREVAAERGIDLGTLKKRDEILAAIEAHDTPPAPGDDGDKQGDSTQE